jgi:hypothetical protein
LSIQPSQPQNACASFTHVVSQPEMQQDSSNEQTKPQQTSSLQNGTFSCSLQQLPASGSPQNDPPVHWSQPESGSFAIEAQI